jgi:hypothetical protein
VSHGIANDILRDEPDCAPALFLIAVLLCKTARYGQAIPLWEKVCRLKPKKPEAWNNLGMSHQECGQMDKAREAFKRALAIKESPDYLGNIAVTFNEQGDYIEGMRWAKKALKLDPAHVGATATLGFSQLALGDWAGWKNYEASLGGKFRKREDFAPDWDGYPVDSLMVYAEQGLGDEIMYASILNDAQKQARQVTLECDSRLAGLFARSFPAVTVHGTRRTDREWEGQFDAQCAIGSLASLFRPTKESCPRTPYLVADPERRLQWRALFDSFGKPVIGIAWSGGNANTRRKDRRVGLEAFRCLIERTDAVFVSLEYKDPTAEIAATGLPVRHYARAVQSPDYDDTAAFIAELDHIVGIHTSVHHLAGALGVPSTILVPHRPMWNYATGDELPWYAAQKFHRQKQHEGWADCIKRLDDPDLHRL